MQLGGEKFTEGTEDLALTLEVGLSLSSLLVVRLAVGLQERLQRVGGRPHLSVEILQSWSDGVMDNDYHDRSLCFTWLSTWCF